MQIEKIWKQELCNGILYFSIRTNEKWIDYNIDPLEKDNTITVTICTDDNINSRERYDIPIDSNDYIVTSFQDKDTIDIFAVPSDLINENIFVNKGKYINVEMR